MKDQSTVDAIEWKDGTDRCYNSNSGTKASPVLICWLHHLCQFIINNLKDNLKYSKMSVITHLFDHRRIMFSHFLLLCSLFDFKIFQKKFGLTSVFIKSHGSTDHVDPSISENG